VEFEDFGWVFFSDFLDGHTTGLRINKEVQAIFVNIFGGILQCDVLTQSILNAAQEVGLKKPIVLRLKGTNADIAKKMLEGK